MEFNFASVDDHLHIASENCNMLIKIRPPPPAGFQQFEIQAIGNQICPPTTPGIQ